MASRYLGGMPRVRSVMALARSFAGSLPHTSAYSLNFFISTIPLPGGALGNLLSLAPLPDERLPFGIPDPEPPDGQLPPLPLQHPPFLFSIALIISSSLTSTSRCIPLVLGPPRVRSRRSLMTPILRAIQSRSLSCQVAMS